MARHQWTLFHLLSTLVQLYLFFQSFSFVSGQTWCGKDYLEGSPIIPPGGQFQFPESSDVPLLNFQCSPSIKPYLKGDSASIVVDARITSSKVPGAAVLENLGTSTTSKSNLQLEVSASIEGQQGRDPSEFVLGNVALNTTGTEFPFSLDSLVPRTEPYTLLCSAKLLGKTYGTSSQLLYLEPPVKGSVTKQDSRTGSLLVKNGDSWEPILPLGFYTSFDGFLGRSYLIMSKCELRTRRTLPQ